MLLIDLNQVVIAALMVQLTSKEKPKLEEGLVRHIVLNNLRTAIKMHRREYPEVIICCDSRHYWRKDIFPYYKAGRKKIREASPVDWKSLFDFLEKIKGELKEVFPYKMIEADGAEADDVIAVLVKRDIGPHLVYSNDKDFVQLQWFGNVRQYASLQKKYISVDPPGALAALKEHIIRGDRGDGIPNFMSPDDSFVTGKRQSPINTKKLKEWVQQTPDQFCNTDSLKRWYNRNQMLIDLNRIPPEVSTKIIDEYAKTKTGSRNKLFRYFIDNNLNALMPVLDEF